MLRRRWMGAALALTLAGFVGAGGSWAESGSNAKRAQSLACSCCGPKCVCPLCTCEATTDQPAEESCDGCACCGDASCCTAAATA